MSWICARCGHGSDDLRDSAAHFDAHRRLAQLEEDGTR